MSHLFDAPAGAYGSRAVRGALLTAGVQALKLGIGFASVIVLSRLLQPRDFGVYAMATPFVGVVLMVQDLGLSQALVVADKVDQRLAAGIFRANVILSLALALMLLALAPAIATFYGEPSVTVVTWGLAASVVLSGMTATHVALLTRGFRFGRLTLIELLRSLGGLAVAVAIAHVVPGPLALVAQFVASSLLGLALAWEATRWWPGHPAGFAVLRPTLRLGVGMTSVNVASFVSRNADNVLIGLTRGAGELGFYDRAYKLLLFPLAQINQPAATVMNPIMARLIDTPGRYRAAYLRVVGLVMAMTVPGIIAMLLTAPALIPALMGEEWRGVAPVFQWLALAGLHQTIANTFNWLFVSQRRAREYARSGFLNMTINLAAFAIGLRWGAIGVAAAYGLSSLAVRLPLNIWLAGRRGPVTSGDIVRRIAPFYLAGAVTVPLWLALAPLAGMTTPVATLAIRVVGVFALFWLLLASMPAGRRTFGDAFTLVPWSARAA